MNDLVLPQADTDRLLMRRLSLQRYVTRIYQDVAALNDDFDGRLLALLNDFVLNADAKSLAALGSLRTSDERARHLLQSIKALVRSQAGQTHDFLMEHIAELLESEVAFVSRVMGYEDRPSLRGLASEPIGGRHQSDIVRAVFGVYLARVLSEVSRGAAESASSITALIRGDRDQRFRNGVLYWRNQRLLKPEVDQLINGNSTNAHLAAYRYFDIEKVSWLATLDFRTCPTCYTAEANSPYVLGRQPRHPPHPYCRCLLIPAHPGVTTERPFVKDRRPVSSIPVAERPGKIGTTRDTIEQFFGRWTDKQREDYMGKTRAKKWREGKITDIKQLVAERTLKPLRLAELPD